MREQLLLDFAEFDEQPSFNNYIPINNEIILASLQSFSQQLVHIIGANSQGKTHLLKSWVALANLRKANSAIYLDLNRQDIDLKNYSNFYRFFALDNIDNISQANQEELFNLFNRAKIMGENIFILTCSVNKLAGMAIREDLKTRIASGVQFNIKSLQDDELSNALVIFAKCRGIKIGINEINYLVNHLTRNLGELSNLVLSLDQEAIKQKKNITLPLIKSVLANKGN